MDNGTDIKVSVIMPIYNAYDFLRPAIDSIIEQTLAEFELICVDDGSTDHSLEILKEYQTRDERIRIVTETNAGPALARNNGMKRARGEYVTFLDADDFVEPTFLDKLYSLAKKDNLDIAISRYNTYNTKKARFEPSPSADSSAIFTPGAVTSKGEHPDSIFSSTVSSPGNKLFRRSFIEEKKLVFLTDVKMYEDVYFVITALSLAERVGKVFEVLMHHRIHSEQSRAKMFKQYYSQIPFVYVRIKEFLVQHGLYAPLSVSYQNVSARCCYEIYNLLQHESKELFWNLLNSEYLAKLGLKNEPLSEITDDEVRVFISNASRFDYAQYEKRCERGMSQDIRKYPSGQMKKQGLAAFFKKIFLEK